jgi:hypothetical protein
MDKRIDGLKTAKEAESLARNAKRAGQHELETAALRRATELRVIEEGFNSPAERAIGEALLAYEEKQRQLKNNPKFRASRTRNMLRAHTPLIAAERMVLSSKPSVGYTVLEDAGLRSLSFEAIIVQFPEEFSEEAVEASKARLSGVPYKRKGTKKFPDSTQVEPGRGRGVDHVARAFMAEHADPLSTVMTDWLPRYKVSVDTIRASIDSGDLQPAFELIWRKRDNSVSNAGQGVIGYEVADKHRDFLIEVIQEIDQDGSPQKFDEIVRRFEALKIANEVDFIPRLLIARAFASIHPELYHTTVDGPSQDRAIPWFVEHTGFDPVSGGNWATKAAALTAHLSLLPQFEGNELLRNTFPWLVIEQLQDPNDPAVLNGSHRPRSRAAVANIPESVRQIRIRHSDLQDELVRILREEFGSNSVFSERATGCGTTADVVVLFKDGRCFLYEIKTAETAGRAIRQAMGQLLEYAYWPQGRLRQTKMVVVAEPVFDPDAKAYLERLRSEFGLAIEYMRLELPGGEVIH